MNVMKAKLSYQVLSWNEISEWFTTDYIDIRKWKLNGAFMSKLNILRKYFFDINNVSVTSTYILNAGMLPRGYICRLHQCSMQEIIRQFMMGKYNNWPNYFMHLALITYLLNSIFTMLTISCSIMAISVTNSLPSPVNFVLFAILSVLSYCRC